MLRIAVQSKGRLYDETMLLLEEAGIKLNRGKRILLLSAKGFPVEVLFLRDDADSLIILVRNVKFTGMFIVSNAVGTVESSFFS